MGNTYPHQPRHSYFGETPIVFLNNGKIILPNLDYNLVGFQGDLLFCLTLTRSRDLGTPPATIPVILTT